MLLPRGVRHCQAHQRAVYKADDQRRGTPASRGYDRNWRKVRALQLARAPLCEHCTDEGRVTAASEVDHIDGNSRNNDPSNLRSLCKPHHSRRTATDQAWGRKRQHGEA